MKKKLKECRHDCFMCQNIIPDWWEIIDLKRSLVKIKKGQKFIEEGNQIQGVFFVQEGFVKVHKHWGTREMIVRFAKKGDIIGHRGISIENSFSPISATAMKDSILCFLELDFLKKILKTNIKFTYELMMFYADELQWSEQKMGNLVHLSVKERFVINLLYLIDNFGLDEDNFLEAELTKTDLATYIGTTYETIYRIILEMEKENILLFTEKRLQIIDIDKLKLLSI